MSAASLTGTAVLDRLRELEAQKQAIEVEQLGLIAQVENECLAADLGAKNTAVLLRDVLHISARDAAGRLTLAQAVLPRRTLTGQPVEPAHPQTAQALTDGAISVRAAATVVTMTDRIDDVLADQSAPLFETALIEFATGHDRRRCRGSPTACTPRSTRTARSATPRLHTGAGRSRCTATPTARPPLPVS